MAGVLRKHEVSLDLAQSPGISWMPSYSQMQQVRLGARGSAFWDLVGAESLGVWEGLIFWMRLERTWVPDSPFFQLLLCEGVQFPPHL